MYTSNNWKEFKNHILAETGLDKYNNNAGIFNSSIEGKKHTSVLRSAYETYYYKDNLDLTDPPDTVVYTLFGKKGDQDLNIHYNKNLLDPTRTKHIYLYRCKKNNNSNTYIWYGKYEIDGKPVPCKTYR